MISARFHSCRASLDTSKALENGIENKYEALQKDRQSVGLKLHSLHMMQLALENVDSERSRFL